MTSFCLFHQKDHDHFEWKNFGEGWVCRDGLQEAEDMMSKSDASFNIGSSGKAARINHWQEIQSRVTTHDGQLLSGTAGRNYQKKWSKKMLGKDLSKPVDYSAPKFQKELAKTV